VQLVGRQRELTGVDGFLELLRVGPAALVLEGEPGIGKTAVWRAAVNAARGRLYRVLVCRASESEGALSFLGLGDLFEAVSDDLVEALPEPQRLALKSALMRSVGETSPDRVGVARGTLSVLRASAAEAPTVVAIDDVQWVDPPSADVLRFVAHRLTDERIGLLLSVRDGGATSLELDHAFPRDEHVRLRLESLSFEELERVVRLHVPVSFTLPTWHTLYRISEGNPFFAIQLAEALERRGLQAPGEAVPIPETLADAMRERLAALSPTARAALLPVAALAQPTLSLMRAGAAEAVGIEEAVQAGVLQIDGERVRFAHPLLASFVYAVAFDHERRFVHEQLVRLVADPEENALHLGRGTLAPDESVAATLEATADQAATRGHPDVAAELAEHGARLTPPKRVSDQARRIRAAASLLFAAGDGPRGRTLLESLVGRLPPSQERARALQLLGLFVDDIPRCTTILEQALAEAGDDLQLRSQVLSRLAMKESWGGDWETASRHLQTAVELAERSGGGAALATALARLAWVDITPARLSEIERAVELERSLTERLPFSESPRFLHGMVLLALDRLEEAQRQLEESYELGVALGDSWRVVHLGFLADLELRTGKWERARADARACEELGPQFGLRATEAWAAASTTLVEAHFGNVDAAVEAGERAARHALPIGLHWALSRSELALGLLHLSAGQEAAALDHLLPLLEERSSLRLHRSLVARTLSNAIEALLGTGRFADASSAATRLEEHARVMHVPSAIAAAARCRAFVQAQDGDLEGARSSIQAAHAEHARLYEPFELARTYLAQGSIMRRDKQKADARDALRRAEAIFDELGARLWLERTRRELARTGISRSLDRGELTPTERRVAELAAAGSQNKEIAGTLFVSVKTVEANLSRAYAKLGVRSRVELAARLADRRRGVGQATRT
jgi:DNA-binding CsgD family transcriptional regulator